MVRFCKELVWAIRAACVEEFGKSEPSEAPQPEVEAISEIGIDDFEAHAPQVFSRREIEQMRLGCGIEHDYLNLFAQSPEFSLRGPEAIASLIERRRQRPHKIKLCDRCQYFSRDGARAGLACAVQPSGPIDGNCVSFESTSESLGK